MNCIGAWLYLDRLSLLSVFSLSGFVLKLHSFFVSSGVQNRSNSQVSDHLIHVERISILWLQNRDRTDSIGTQFNSVSNNLKFKAGIMKKSKYLRAILASLGF